MPVLGTRICISLMLEFVCVAMVPEFHPRVRLPPSRAGQRVPMAKLWSPLVAG